MELLYQDQNIVVCVKPTGVLSQTGKEGQESMLSLLSSRLGGDFYPVHRLDKEVGGVMVYARNQKAAGELSRQIQQGNMKKEYLAVVSGCPEAKQGVYEDLLLHDMKRNKSYVVDRERKGVKKARLSYAVLDHNDERSLVQIRLFTGRTHQIRVQFSSRRMPLVGDGRYGGGNGKIHLWSCRLTFRYGGEWMEFCHLPERDFWNQEYVMTEME